MNILIKQVQLNGELVDVLVEGNRFSRIAPQLDVDAACVIDGTDKAIIPSFVNAHTHASMTLLRGYADDLELHTWLTEHIWPLESKMTEVDIYHGARLACLEMIKSGTTCFNDMYWYYHGTARAVEEMGLRAVLSSVFIDFNDPVAAEKQCKETEQLFEAAEKYSDRIHFALGPHAIYTVSESSLKWIASFAKKHQLLIHIHLSETEKEVADCVAQHGVRPVEYLHRMGFLSSNVIAAHAIHLTDEEIELLATHGVRVVHNPASNMKLCSGAFPYPRLQAAGVAISLGTDGCSSNNNLDMLEEMKIATLNAKLSAADPTVMSAQEIFEIATRGGAEVLGLDCGVIAEGKWADCLLIDRSNHRLAPGYNLISDLVYSADRSCIDTVICNGEILMQDGRVDGEEEIIAEAREYALKYKRSPTII